MITFIKNTIPIFIKQPLKYVFRGLFKFFTHNEIKKTREGQSVLVDFLKKKEKIDVLFLLIHQSVWKCEELYRLLDKENRFNVSIAIIPFVRGNQVDTHLYNSNIEYFKNNNYNIVDPYDSVDQRWIDIKEMMSPDIVFFTNPHKLTFDKYYIKHFRNTLTCYIPYTFDITSNFDLQYNQNFHKSLWKFFVETKYQYDFSQMYSTFINNNVVVSGFIGLDHIFKKEYHSENVWKICDYDTKKIIWAPHHTIEGQGSGLDYSCFLHYHQYFLDLLQNRDDIQMAFKPHPLLKEKLYLDKEWGKERADNYYSKWDSLANGQLEEGNYCDLFFHSDAMILDSASFTVEYLYFDKPSLFTLRDKNIEDRFNTFGCEVFSLQYKANTSIEINKFIKENVLNQKDSLRNKRNVFLQKTLNKDKKISASQNIINKLNKELN
tara:strand:+ start:1051 stop:2352 length:1302 start_codon:yes stop_codon:yes gene_type:complete